MDATMRQNWDEYFMDLAFKVSERGTCDRRYVGSVIVNDVHIISTGYNGSMVGADHCDNAGHDMVEKHCVRTVHSEVNAIAQAAKLGSPINGSTMYVTDRPCFACFKLIVNAGIHKVYYVRQYDNELVTKYYSPMEFTQDGFRLVKLVPYEIPLRTRDAK
jgi:dCMP deaminase